jgi:hypothetical protein
MFDWLVLHIIGSLPTWIWITIAATGGVGYLSSGLIFVFLPFLLVYKEPFKILCIVICLGGTFMCGGEGVTSIWQSQLKDAQARVDQAEADSKQANVALKKLYTDRVQNAKNNGNVIQSRIIKEAEKIDAECKIDPATIKDLNDAAVVKK